ncbi:MAG: hypothetical protein LQ337_004124 [Flavoplaca oasis]|nr:MAG: hypothetical protein LQ337_004124 [Flavoplaca oasis]
MAGKILSNALQIFYNPLIFITKLSILLQYLVIFVPNSTGKTYWAIHFVIWVNLLFYLAVIACIASIMRMVNNVQYAQTQDYTFRLTAVALWTLGEIASGIVCSCLPVVPAFFRHYMPKLTSSFKSSLEKVKGSRSGGQESLSKSGSEWDRERGFIELTDKKASKRARLEYEPDRGGLVMDGYGGERDGVEFR